MNDRKSLAIILGAAVGVAAVAATVTIYSRRRHDDPNNKDINDVFDQARKTVRKLDEAVDLLRKSTT